MAELILRKICVKNEKNRNRAWTKNRPIVPVAETEVT